MMSASDCQLHDANNPSLQTRGHAWSPQRRFAGRTDIPITAAGEASAALLGRRLQSFQFDQVRVSPLMRARRTADIAGFGQVARVDERLVEWNFGEYEGKLRGDVCQVRPGWTYLRDGCPGGETAADVGRRADGVIADLREARGSILIFGHSVALRVLAVRWIGLPPDHARHLALAPASLSILGYDPVEDAPVIRLWNDTSHLQTPQV